MTANSGPVLEVLTWGFNRSPVPQANLTVDARWIPNPWHRPELHDMSGLDGVVQEWVFAQRGVSVWFEALLDVLGPMVATAQERGLPLVTVAIGCQGGHDRSVALAVRLGEAFERAGTRTHLRHLSFVRGRR